MVAVSVVMPVHNGGPFLKVAIDSVLTQTWKDLELLVLDDGSTDDSLQTARSAAARDRRVRVTSRENRGLVVTLNELIASARGALIARMDADDICLPDRLAIQVAYLRDHADVVCVGGAYQLIDEADRQITTMTMPMEDSAIQRLALLGHCPICHPCVMMRREALLRAGGYRPEFYPAEDLDLWLRLGELGKLANLAVPVLRYRLHSGSICSTSSEGRQRDALKRGCEDAWRRRGITQGTFEATEAFRPTSEPESRLLFSVRYGWWAFNSGERTTAAFYAWKALRIRPASKKAWVLLLCCIVKRIPPEEGLRFLRVRRP